MRSTHDWNRRRFLFSVSGAAVAAAGGSIVVPGCSTGGMGDAGGDAGGGAFVNTGLTVGDVAMGTVVAASVRSLPALVGRDANGLYALDATCTHQGCIVSPMMPGRIDCPCHQSHYDLVGTVVMPAPGSVNQGPLFMVPLQFGGTGAAATISVKLSARITDRTMRFPAP